MSIEKYIDISLSRDLIKLTDTLNVCKNLLNDFECPDLKSRLSTLINDTTTLKYTEEKLKYVTIRAKLCQEIRSFFESIENFSNREH